jgi:hypothetical protein
MSWARFDDRFHGNPKVLRAWHDQPASVGLYVMSVTYCAQHETDGLVHDWFVASLVPRKPERAKLTGVLERGRLWVSVDEGWQIPDYLDFNPSRRDIESRRIRDAERKRRGRDTQSRVRADSERTPHGIHAPSSGPVPTRPDPTNPDPSETRDVGGPSLQLVAQAAGTTTITERTPA